MNRRWFLGLAAVFAAGLNWFADPISDSAVVAPTTRDKAAPPQAALRPSNTMADMPQPRVLVPRDWLYAAEAASPAGRDLFGERNWMPPPPAAAAPSAPEVEETPPFPYTYAGQMQEDDKIEVYLTRDKFAYLAKPGDTLEGTYRVEAITSTQLRVVHLPTSRTQTIRIGDAD